jgi:hypothetical protein
MLQNLPKIAKFCQKTTSLRNFEITPKIEILVYLFIFEIQCVGETLKYVPTIWIFIPKISPMPISLSKNGLCM